MKTIGLSISKAVQMAVDTDCKIRRMDWDPKAYIFLEEGSGEFLWHDCETFVPTYESLCGDDWEIVSERKKMSFLAAMDLLKQGKRMTREAWTLGERIWLNHTTLWREFPRECMPVDHYRPKFEDLDATDWMEWQNETTNESNPPESLHEVKCDRCGKLADFESGGGNCAECGDDLCLDCAGRWTELAKDDEPGHAVCAQCAREEWCKGNEPKLAILHKIQKEVNDYLGYLGSTGNECAWTDRTIEAIIEQAKQLEIIQNECIERL